MFKSIEEINEALSKAKQQFELLHKAASTIAFKVNKQGNYIVSTATNADQLALKEAQAQCSEDPFTGLQESINKLVLTPKPAVKPAAKAKAPAKKKPAVKS